MGACRGYPRHRVVFDATPDGAADGEPIYVPSVCLVELTYLTEKGRVPLTARKRRLAALDDPKTLWRRSTTVSPMPLSPRAAAKSRTFRIESSRLRLSLQVCL